MPPPDKARSTSSTSWRRNGKHVGGCDIVMEIYDSGELAELLGVEQPDEDAGPLAPAVEAPQSAPLGLEKRLS